MAPTAQQIVSLLSLLPDTEKILVMELVQHLIPDDVATPEDIADIAEARAAFARGECITLDDFEAEQAK